MARFNVYRMRDVSTVPLVVDVQADLLEDLRTRVVIPLLPLPDAEREAAPRLKPIVDVAGEPYVLLTTDLSAIPISTLGEWVTSIQGQRQAIVDALDFLFQGF